MDPRHETKEQQHINQFIDQINSYLQANKKVIAENDILRAQLIYLLTYLYFFSKEVILPNDYLSNDNLFSSDSVLLPHIDELNLYKLDESQFFLKNIIALSALFDKFVADSDELSLALDRFFKQYNLNI